MQHPILSTHRSLWALAPIAMASGLLLCTARAQAQDAAPVPDAPDAPSAPVIEAAPVAVSAPVTAINDANTTIGAGFKQGLTSGQLVTVTRGGVIIALLRLAVVEENSATGTLVWSDDTKAAVVVGDTIDVMAPPQTVLTPGPGGVPVAGSPGGVKSDVIATPVPFETGASNFSVPKADRTYELLASLAARGLITSQPARVFQDEGARRHNASEDFIFTRAQVAGFIREALQSGKSEGSQAALKLLITDFRSDLLALGVPEADLAPFGEATGLQIGFSGFSRAQLAGGETGRGARLPFAERYGAGRTKSGLDQRLNLFGTSGSRLSFYGSLDLGTARVAGGSSSTQLRKAYVSYDASNLIKGLTVNVGRKEFYWGVGSFGTGVLGDAPGGLNSISTSLQRGVFHFESIYSPLGKHRSIYGNQISANIGTQTRIGLSSTLLEPKDNFDPIAFVGAQFPISLYAVKQFIKKDKNDPNTVIGAFAETSVARGARLYGEITLDDIAFTGNNRVENRDGGLVGIQLFTPKDPTRLGLTAEFSRLSGLSYIGLRRAGKDADYDYYYRDAPLGYPIAPEFPTNFGGAESLRFEGYYKPTKKLTLHAGIEISDINSEDQGPAAVGERGLTRQQTYRLAAAYDLSHNFTLTARARRVNTNQPEFIKRSASDIQKLFSLEIARSF